MSECSPKNCGFSHEGVCLDDIKLVDFPLADDWKEQSKRLDEELVRFRGQEFELSELFEVLDKYPRCIVNPYIEAYFSNLQEGLAQAREVRKSQWV